MDAAVFWSWVATGFAVISVMFLSLYLRTRNEVFRRDLVLKDIADGKYRTLGDAVEMAKWSLGKS